jgi:hypothetical protein
MKTLAELYAEVPIGKGGYRLTDRDDVHSYVEVYEKLLAPYRRPGVRVLEIGLFHGAGLRVWEQYFDQGCVWGVDASETPHDGLADLRPMMAERWLGVLPAHNIVIADATDREAVSRHFGDMTFDVIIEDAAHSVPQQVALYRLWSERLRSGGLYVIEDVANLDYDRAVFENIDPKRKVEILDRRKIKNRFDDIMVVIR